MHWHICATTRSLVAAKRKEAHSWAMAVPEAICQSGVRWKFGILTVYLQCSAVLDPRVWHHGILHLAAEFASMHFATGVKEQRGQGPVILCHLQFHTFHTTRTYFRITFSWPLSKSTTFFKVTRCGLYNSHFGVFALIWLFLKNLIWYYFPTFLGWVSTPVLSLKNWTLPLDGCQFGTYRRSTRTQKERERSQRPNKWNFGCGRKRGEHWQQ